MFTWSYKGQSGPESRNLYLLCISSLSLSFFFLQKLKQSNPNWKEKNMITKSLTKRESEDIFLKIPINCKIGNDQSFITSISKSTSSSYAARNIKKKILQGSGKLVFPLVRSSNPVSLLVYNENIYLDVLGISASSYKGNNKKITTY